MSVFGYENTNHIVQLFIHCGCHQRFFKLIATSVLQCDLWKIRSVHSWALNIESTQFAN